MPTSDLSLDNLLRAQKGSPTFVEKITKAFFVRPADTTQYGVNEVVGDGKVMHFPAAVSKNGGSGYIVKARIMTNDPTTTSALFRLLLYRFPPAAIADNAAKPLLWANRESGIGHIDFALSTEGTGSDAANDLQTSVNLPFIAAPGDTGIYGLLVAKATFTPAANSTKYYIELTTESFE